MIRFVTAQLHTSPQGKGRISGAVRRDPCLQCRSGMPSRVQAPDMHRRAFCQNLPAKCPNYYAQLPHISLTYNTFTLGIVLALYTLAITNTISLLRTWRAHTSNPCFYFQNSAVGVTKEGITSIQTISNPYRHSTSESIETALQMFMNTRAAVSCSRQQYNDHKTTTNRSPVYGQCLRHRAKAQQSNISLLA